MHYHINNIIMMNANTPPPTFVLQSYSMYVILFQSFKIIRTDS